MGLFSRRRRTPTVVLAAIVIVLGLAVTTVSSSADSQDGAVGTTDLLRTPEPLDTLLGAALSASAHIPRSKVDIEIPGVTALVYAGTQARKPLNPDNAVYPVPAGLEPPDPLPQCNYYVNAIQNDLYIATVDEEQHRFTSLGHFPDARVAAMAFGSLPVTATLRLSQVVRDGKLVPIQANTIGNGASIPKDQPQTTSDYGCDRAWEQALPAATISTGEVNAVFTDVEVDGRPVDVGPNCHTKTPLELRLIGESPDLGGGYSSVVEGGTLTMSRDTRTTGGEVPLPLFPKSRNLTIPDFVDCRSASGDDTSPLVSALASGPQATLAVVQSPVSFALTNLQEPTLCSLFDGSCPQPPEHVAPPPAG